MKTILLLAGLLLASVAVAQAVTDQYKVTLQPQKFAADVITSQRIGATTINVDGGLALSPTGTQIRRSYQASRSYDFPSIGSDLSASQTCVESFALTSTGTKVGDFCIPSTNLGVDGGATLLLEAQMTCRAATNATYVRLCAHFTDGGAYDPGDAGWSTITFGP